MIKYPALLFFFSLILFSCGKNTLPHTHSLDEKSEPYDQFSFQRSYPDRDFDWKGWRNSVQQTRLTETAASRGGGPGCGTNLSNWTQQGPMNVGARCNTLAAKPDDENTVLAGFAGGGIFKSIDGGVKWHPVFDENPELAIGTIAFAPSNSNVVYVGTGDPNIPSIVFNGDGIYKSTDAGESWQHLPNSPNGIASRIVVHPSDPNVLWAAMMGNPYVRDNERGVYKSTDGGNTWQQVLFVSNQAGASDLVQSPANPQILFASFWDRIRNNQESIVYGPNAKVFKSVDGGTTWTQLGGGLPTGIMCKTGLAISKTNPDKVYAVYVDTLLTPGGLYKTTDGGATWTSLNITQLEDACADFGWYFGKITLNPANDEDLYFHAILLYRKQIGNNSWLNAAGGHADSHDLIFTSSGRRYWANDGGVYRNDGQQSWVKSKNLPVTQFYRCNYNPHEPNNYWAGAQDNGIQKGNGLNPNSWFAVFSADGFSSAFDPADANHFWVETQNGSIHETTDGGNSWQFGAAALGSSDRTNWDTPFFMSPNIPNRFYAATYRVYGKDAGGGWGAISGDLTDGINLEPKFHTISCLNESSVTPNKLLAGTSDGNVWRRDANGTWANITAGLPNRYVTSVRYSPTLSNRIFVTHSGYRDNEHIPHVHRSDDNGISWQDISSNLPQVPVNDLFILPGQSDQTLFAATDVGVYFSLNAGSSWNRLGGNMPYIPVFDLDQNPVRKELIAATFARGIWTFPFDSIFVQQNPVSVSLSGTVRDEMGEGVVETIFENVLSDDNGVFTLPNVSGCTPYTLAPARNDNPLNGVTTYDLVLISKHILSIEPFNSPYKMIAADANHSGSVTSFDIVQLRKLILGIDSVLVKNSSWRFVPSNYVFDNPLNPFQSSFPETLAVQVLTAPISGLNFIGIKVGDVNNSSIPHLNGLSNDRTEGEWPLSVDWETKDQIGDNAASRVEAIFSAGYSALSALQFSVQFDPKFLIFEKIEPLTAGLSIENFGLNRTENGLLSFSYSPEKLEESGNTPLFKVIFRLKGTIDYPEHLRLTNWPTPSLAYLPSGIALKPVLIRKTELSTPIIAPNPFGMDGLWISSAKSGTLEIFDLRGRRLFVQNIDLKEPIHLDSNLFKASGVYLWRLGDQSGKLVFAP